MVIYKRAVTSIPPGWGPVTFTRIRTKICAGRKILLLGCGQLLQGDRLMKSRIVELWRRNGGRILVNGGENAAKRRIASCMRRSLDQISCMEGTRSEIQSDENKKVDE